MLDVRARKGLSRILDPVGHGLARLGVTATMVTVLGLAVTVGGAVFIALGRLVAGALVGGAGALLDLFDGPIARATGTASRRGALVDTLADRLGEAALWSGLAYYVAPDAARVVLTMTALGLSMLVPFIRSKAEGWGIEGKGGFMGRAERMILMLLFVGLEGFDLDTILPMLWIFNIAVGLTVVQRSYRTWAQLAE